MKKLVFAVALGLVATGAYAQKANVKAADKLATSNVAEARKLATEARNHEETKADPYAWFVSGSIEEQLFQKELLKAQLGQPHDEPLMFEALTASVPFLLKTYELENVPNEKGKVKLKYANKAKDLLKSNLRYLINAGYHYVQNEKFEKSIDAFNLFLDVRNHPLLAEDKDLKTAEIDTMTWDAGYLAVAAAFEGKLHDKAIAAGLRSKHQGYKQNEIYQLLIASYLAKQDSVSALPLLDEGAKLFPTVPYYLGNIVNIYATQGKTDEAIKYLESAINGDPKNLNYLNAMGGLYERKEDWDASAKWYTKALEVKNDDFDANHNLGRSYFNQAVTLLSAEKIDKLTQDKAKTLFAKALPYLEVAYKSQPEQVYYILANTYDRLDRKADYDRIMAAHK